MNDNVARVAAPIPVLPMLACLAVVAGTVALVSAPPLLRLPLGLATALFIPGYALTAVVFPTSEHLDRIERAALSLGCSLGLVAVLALLLDRLPGGLSAGNIRVSVALLCAGLVVAALFRRSRLPRFATPPAPAPRSRTTTRVMRFTQAIVAANVVVAAVAFALTLGDRAPIPTEFYVLGAEGRLEGYPSRVMLDNPIALSVGLRQGSAEGGRYELLIEREGSRLASIGPIVVGPGDEWESEVQVRLSEPGPDQEVELNLVREGDTQPFRTLRLWVNVERPNV